MKLTTAWIAGGLCQRDCDGGPAAGVGEPVRDERTRSVSGRTDGRPGVRRALHR